MIAYAIVWTLARLLAALPLGLALAIGRALGAFAFHVIRLRRAVVFSNIAHVFPEMPDGERRAIALDAYRQLGMMFVEILRSSVAEERDLVANFTIPETERFVALREKKAPVIFLQAHAGNFDLVAYSFAMRGFPHHTVMRAIKNPRIHRMIVGTREGHGITVHVKAPDSMDRLREALSRGEWIGLLPDQNAKTRGVTIDWIGKPASVYRGPALLHLETGAQIVCVVDSRRRDDPRKHEARMIFLPPHVPTGDRDADVKAVMQAVADAFAAEIRRNPSQYFWFHRLWGKELARGAARAEASAGAEV